MKSQKNQFISLCFQFEFFTGFITIVLMIKHCLFYILRELTAYISLEVTMLFSKVCSSYSPKYTVLTPVISFSNPVYTCLFLYYDGPAPFAYYCPQVFRDFVYSFSEFHNQSYIGISGQIRYIMYMRAASLNIPQMQFIYAIAYKRFSFIFCDC